MPSLTSFPIGLAFCSRCGGGDPNCSVCQDIPASDSSLEDYIEDDMEDEHEPFPFDLLFDITPAELK